MVLVPAKVMVPVTWCVSLVWLVVTCELVPDVRASLAAVDTSVAVERIASKISCVPSSAILANPPVTPRFKSVHAAPGRSPCISPSGPILVCERRSRLTPATEASMRLAVPSGLVTEVNDSSREPERLIIRGFCAFATLPSSTLPAGNTKVELTKIGSISRARKVSPS